MSIFSFPPVDLAFFSGPITAPVPVFLIIMVIMLVAPLVFERFKLPGIVGLIMAGFAVGPNGLDLLERDATIILLGTVGLLFLMFMAGLETSLDDLKRDGDKALVFGLLTFIVPMVIGTLVMKSLGYSILSALLIASCFASHTLLSLPIASNLGIMRNKVLTATLGGTLITNVLALLLLAALIEAHQGTLGLKLWLGLIPSLIIYTGVILWSLPQLGRWFFKRFGHNDGAEFTFVIAVLFIVAYGAELIGIEPIVGAFLAGIAITQLIPALSPLMNRIQFIGNNLFIPFFLISVGMLIDLGALISDPKSILITIAMSLSALVVKFIPAWICSRLFGYTFPGLMVMFGLSVAQAASTLAAITIAYKIELVDQPAVNGTIAMIMVTCIASPWVTEKWGKKLASQLVESDTVSNAPLGNKNNKTGLRILVPVANPSTEANLLDLGMLLAKHYHGVLLVVNIILDRKSGISSQAKSNQRLLLDNAKTVAHSADVAVEAIARIDSSIDRGLLRVTQEQDANLIICGWGGYSSQTHLFNRAIDKLLYRSVVPMLVTRLTSSLPNTKRVMLVLTPAQVHSSSGEETVEFTKVIANQLKTSLELILLKDEDELTNLPEQLTDLTVTNFSHQQVHNFASLIKPNDLLILLTEDNNNLWGLSIAGIHPEALARLQEDLSLIVFHFPKDFSY